MNTLEEVYLKLMEGGVPAAMLDALYWDPAGQSLGCRDTNGQIRVEPYGEHFRAVFSGERGRYPLMLHNADAVYRFFSCFVKKEINWEELPKEDPYSGKALSELSGWMRVQAGKSGKAGQRIALFIGLLFLGLGGFVTIAGVAVSFTDSRDLMNFAVIALGIGTIYTGIQLVRYARKRHLNIVMEVTGCLLLTFSLVMIVTTISESYVDPSYSGTDLIGMSVLFLIIAALGAAMMIGARIVGRRASGADRITLCALPDLPEKEERLHLIRELRETTKRPALVAYPKGTTRSKGAEKESAPSVRGNIARADEAADSVFISKAGGLPYWDPALPYPVTKAGESLALLAQVNLAELPENPYFPREGMLQFFICPDEMYGLDHDPQVVFHKAVDRGIFREEICAIGMPTSVSLEDAGEDFPVHGVLPLEFRMEEVFLSEDDYRATAYMHALAGRLGIRLSRKLAFYELFTEEPEELEAFRAQGEKSGLFVYPGFVQGDPRAQDPVLEKYDSLLFQLHSIGEYEALRGDASGRGSEALQKDGAGSGCVMWGDGGIGNFFISEQSFTKGDFSDVFYSWDCG